MYSGRTAHLTVLRLLLVAIAMALVLEPAAAQGQGGLGTVPGLRVPSVTLKVNLGQGGGGPQGP